METLIFIAIAVVITIIQKKMEKAKEQQNQLPPHRPHSQKSADESESQESSQEHRPPRSLQDLIRQFEDAQRQAAQGNIEPPTPPVEHKRQHTNGMLTLRDIAEVVIEVDFIDLQFLMEAFEVDENTAAEMLMDLQAHRIVGHDMGEGTCDVLVHDLEELDNLLNHENQASKTTAQENRVADDAHQRELERQRELNALEDRAKTAREAAAAIAGMEQSDASAETAPRRLPQVSAKNISDVRKGFIWAKVLDEPRFKRRWSTQYR